MKKISVLIVDDHALVREGIIAFLKYHDDIQVWRLKWT
jgi:DNA-binding NarL/FixJ family response regulator